MEDSTVLCVKITHRFFLSEFCRQQSNLGTFVILRGGRRRGRQEEIETGRRGEGGREDRRKGGKRRGGMGER